MHSIGPRNARLITARRVLLTLLIQCLVSGANTKIDSDYFSEMRWRLIGPFRGGRTVAISGVLQQQNVYYMAPNNGGVWKSTDYGHTWAPIFDGQDTGRSARSLSLRPIRTFCTSAVVKASSGQIFLSATAYTSL